MGITEITCDLTNRLEQSGPDVWLCFAAFAGAGLLTLIATPVAARLAGAYGIVDVPGARSAHDKPIPCIGGAAILGCVAATLALVAVWFGPTCFRIMINLQAMAVALAAAGIFGLGLVDDAAHLRARTKLLAEVLIALGLCVVRLTLPVAQWLGLTENVWWIDWPVTIVWVVAITNALNLADGLDGLAAGVGVTACVALAVCGIADGHVAVALAMACLCGGLCGFWVYNAHPARVFLGDGGSLLAGFGIAAASMACAAGTRSMAQPAIVVAILSVPLLDMALAVVRRFSQRRTIFSPDRQHIHHRLIDGGLSPRRAVGILHGMALFGAILGMGVRAAGTAEAGLLFMCVLAADLRLFRRAGALHIRQIAAGIKCRFAIRRRSRRELARFETARLRLSRVRTLGAWRAAFSRAAADLNVRDLSLSLEGSDPNAIRSKVLLRDGEQGICGRHRDIARVRMPVHTLNSPHAAELNLTIERNGSFEAAGRTAMLLGRLLDEYPPGELFASSEVFEQRPQHSRPVRPELRVVHFGRMPSRACTECSRREAESSSL